MDPGANADAQDGSKYISKFFPPNSAIFSLVNQANQEPLFHLVRQTILHHMRSGHSLIELWKEAFDAGYAETETGPYSLYLTAVRKTLGRMFNLDFNKPTKASEQLEFGPPKALAEGLLPTGPGTEAVVKTESPSPANPVRTGLSPLAPSFLPGKPVADKPARKLVKKEEDSHPKKTVNPRLASFEKRCKKLGVRISSAKE
ncbi:uncharacterized protein F4812DRAFT_463941 [Daldinia caldariorum]|uniref:uncharacterized protein n=1 Tax=Daldinia caldariorum TaxID=326644 RepID=UPI00200791B0|nr:uncharacterized protein F4812DRAFT_463941 [Daldinia caldariorum]KAI1463248.1 hypothetical protein F4812DRAFT_463941 [Daldinia caldariorum]